MYIRIRISMKNIDHKQKEFKTYWDMYDPAIATVHPGLVSVDRGSQVDVCGHFSHMNLYHEPMHVNIESVRKFTKRSIEKVEFKPILALILA